jgi:pimeloyl-ACP methyl ester carboxylesterase
MLARYVLRPPDPPTYDRALPGLEFIPFGQTTLPVRRFASPNGRMILYCHGNGDDIGGQGAEKIAAAFPKWEVVAVEYPGYGLAAGEASANGLFAAVVAAFDHEVNEKHRLPSDIVVFGFSIGTGPALRLAAEHPSGPQLGGLILGAPYTTVRDVALAYMPRLRHIPCVIPVMFDNVAAIRRAECHPILLLHNENDPLIPFAHAHQLVLASGGRANLVSDDKAAGHSLRPEWLADVANKRLSELVH